MSEWDDAAALATSRAAEVVRRGDIAHLLANARMLEEVDPRQAKSWVKGNMMLLHMDMSEERFEELWSDICQK